MRIVRPTVTGLLALCMLSCGASTRTQQGAAGDPASPAAASASSAAAEAPVAPAVPPTPTACADPSAEVCTPPPDYAEWLCSRSHQDLALSLFAKTTPFTRMYLRGKLDELAWDEEVLALRFYGKPKGGIQVGSGTGTYDVLRWNGECSRAVEAEMITKSRPAKPKTARVAWHRLGDKTQNALIAGSDSIKKAHSKRGKECEGAMGGEVSSACEKADAVLVTAIVEYVRGGGALAASSSH